MDTEDGQLWVYGVGEDGVMAFTDHGVDVLRDLIQIHKDDPGILVDQRKPATAALTLPHEVAAGEA